MSVYVVVLLAVLNSISQRGSKVAVSLYALDLGAGAAAVGVLAALFAAFPLLLAVHAGRISDRYGVRVPMAAGSIVMAAGLVLPFAGGGLATLFVVPALVGFGHIYFHVSVHNLVGTLGGEAERTRNFATFSLGSSIAAFIGPSAAGFAIELASFATAFTVLAVAAALPAVYLLLAPHAARRRARRGGGSERVRFARHSGAQAHADSQRRRAHRHRALFLLSADLRPLDRPRAVGDRHDSLHLCACRVRRSLAAASARAPLYGSGRADRVALSCRGGVPRRAGPRQRYAARGGGVRARPRAWLGAAAHHHPHVQPRARRALGRGARHAHHGEQGDADRRAARVRRRGRRARRGAGVSRHRRLPARRGHHFSERRR